MTTAITVSEDSQPGHAIEAEDLPPTDRVVKMTAREVFAIISSSAASGVVVGGIMGNASIAVSLLSGGVLGFAVGIIFVLGSWGCQR